MFRNILFYFILVTLSLPSGPMALAATPLDDQLDRLYDQVTAKFEQNPWFRNSSDPEVDPHYARSRPPVPEYQMMDRALFRSALKSYCTLLESPQGKQVKNRGKFGIVNFSQHSAERRFFIYDVNSKEIAHNLWTTHAGNSRLNFWWGLAGSGFQELASIRKVALQSSESNATLFSNRPGSDQSSVGMAVAETETYYSAKNKWHGLRLNGLDGNLNNKLFSRGVVFHEWGFNGETIRYKGEAPPSQGCTTLPTTGFYRGVENAPVAKIIMREIAGAPILLYHDRMSADGNESAYQAQLDALRKLRSELQENMTQLQTELGWEASSRDRYEAHFEQKLTSTYTPLIEETYRYFKSRSAFYGVEPRNPAACERALGLTF